jgi:circadian clock protein KaiB
MSEDIGVPPRLRLYVALATPNSERAVENLMLALAEMGDRAKPLGVEVVDVFNQPRRAITDGVIVTPTLIGLRGEGRVVMIGDLTDKLKLHGLLNEMTHGLDMSPSSGPLADAGGMVLQPRVQ